MIDLFWSAMTSYLALSIIGIVAIAALVVGHVPFGKYAPIIGPYVVLAQFVAYPTLMLLAFLVGVRVTDERAALKQVKQDLAFSQLQLDAQKQSAETADKLRQEAKQQAEQANQKVTEYEAELAKQPANGNCTLTDDDLRRLRDIAH